MADALTPAVAILASNTGISEGGSRDAY